MPEGSASRIDILGALPPLTTAALADQARQVLQHSGCDVRLITGEDLADPNIVNESTCDLLIVPSAAFFPAAAQSCVLSYLRSGGRLLFLGGPPFTHYVYHDRGAWKTWDDLAATVLTDARAAEISPRTLAQWMLSGSDLTSHPSLSIEPGTSGAALHVDLPRFTEWDYVSPPRFPVSPFGAENDLFVFRAKGDANTRSLAVEWREQDGSRWIGAVPLTSTWKRYAMSPADFRYWPDNPSKGRGGPNDQFHPANASGLSVGIASSAAATAPGPKSFWIADLGVARFPGVRATPPILEALSPEYKLRDARPGAWEPICRFLAAGPADPPGRLRILDAAGNRPLQWMFRPNGGPYKAGAWGACSRPETCMGSLPELVRELLATLYVTHAGPAACFRQGEPVEFSVREVNRGSASQTVHVALRVYDSPRVKDRGHVSPGGRRLAVTVVVPPRADRTLRIRWPGALSSGDHRFSFSFLTTRSGFPDTFSGRFTVLPRNSRPGPLLAVRHGDFVLDGKPWRVVGVNYFPLSVTGEDPGAFQRDWLRPEVYDPEAAEADLSLMQRLHINAVSVLYLYTIEAVPLDDFLARCRVHGIRANVFLGGGNPLASDTTMLKSLIAAADLASNDAVFAYDLAWEPHAGHHSDRKRLDAEWQQWVLDNYGSIATAERDWGMTAPREDGRLTNPADRQLMQDGPWRRWVAAYRRFMDDRISHGYRDVCAAIRAVDPHHLLGARSGWGGNGSLFAEGGMAFDLRAGAKHLDFISPEGYALSGEWQAFRDGGGFTTAYARWAGGGKPVFWAEFGESVYPEDASKLASQGKYFDNICHMVLDSGANGQAGWWWPGGLRVDEGTDFGIIGPDGKPRPAALAIRRYALQSPHAGRRTLAPMIIDRDRDARGYAGIYETGHAAYDSARGRGQLPLIRTAGTGSTTATMPLLAVGDTPADGSNPLKYCNAEFNAVRFSDRKPGSVLLSVSMGNTGEATWLSSGAGRVVLTIRTGERILALAPLRTPVPRFGDAVFAPVRVAAAAGERITLRLAILGRAAVPLAFGEKSTIPF